MDSIKIDNGYLIGSVTRQNQWFYISGLGFETEIILEMTEEGRNYSFSHRLQYELKNKIIQNIKETDGFRDYKKKWENLQNNGDNFYRSETNRRKLLRKVLGDRAHGTDEPSKVA